MEPESMMRKLLRLSGNVLPYVDWVLPIIERALGVGGNDAPAVLAALDQSGKEWKAQLHQLQASQQELLPALAEQQRRLDRMEQRSVEMADVLVNVADNQAEMTRQVAALAQWVRVAAVAGIIFTVFLAGLAVYILRHKMGHFS